MIRKITPADRENYIEMARDFYSSPAVLENIPAEYIERTFDEIISGTPFADCYIFEKDGDTAGYGLLSFTYSQEAGGLCVWIEEIYIKPCFRSKGMGGDFISFVKESVPAARLRLETEPENLRVQELYKRHGFKKLAYMQFYSPCSE